MKDLNKQQQEAVLYEHGPLLIVAGAGTGKTTVITKRIAHLIEKGLAKPEEILGVTFTDKAAGEMEERVDRLLDFGYADLWISTFHSFCERILKEHGLDIGLPTDFKLLDQTSAWLMVRNNIDKFELDYYKPMGNPTKFIHAMLKHFSRLKDEVIYPEEYLQYADDCKQHSNVEDLEEKRIKEIANAYHVYQKLLLDNNSLDFGDLINYCLKLFEQRPQILKKYQDQFKYILVDEFQDTNWAQYQLVKQLVADDCNLTVCADSKQSIFKFRGASTSNVLQFKKDFPNAKNVVLTENYRSYQEILDLSYNFIRHNGLDETDKKLKAFKKGKANIELFHFSSLQKEISGIADKILELDTDLSNIVVLIRANSSAEILSKEFERRGISHEFLASKGLYSKPIILDVIAYLKIVNNSFESKAVNRILNSSFLSISFEDLSSINQYSKKKGLSTYETLQSINLIKGLKCYKNIEVLLNLIEKHSKLKKVSHIFIDFINESGLLKKLIKEHRERDIDLISQFYKKIKAFEEIDDSLHEFIEQIGLELEAGNTGELDYSLELDPDTVKIMTIHSAKGLEFDYVFIPNLVDKRFPTIKQGESIPIPDDLIKEIIPQGDVDLQEERRLFYVALTRARKGLFLSYADDYGGTRAKKPSRFIQELDLKQSDIDSEEKLEKKNIKEIDYKDKIPSYFSYSQLEAFKNCPLQYKFAHILKIPRRGSHVFSFGRTMHNVLYKALNFNQAQLFDTEVNLNEKDLLDLYEKEFIDEWYEDKKQREEYFKKGKDILKQFLKDFLKEKPKPVHLELNFKTKFNDNMFIGRIDRIDDNLEIIDYKTGKPKDKLSQDDKEQLLIYQIAAKEIIDKMPEKMSYYYLDNNVKISFSSTEEERKEVKQNIEKRIGDIKNSKFNATPGFQCKFCDFKDICEFRKLN